MRAVEAPASVKEFENELAVIGVDLILLNIEQIGKRA
jgi:hypothetical protein